ncbi:MAG: hypothetical protein HRT90_11680 [Candidatus Margulisbacteria bacterium]|nr:hypothetical protein [Candidatus Margulisiibacteriota bacterium]
MSQKKYVNPGKSPSHSEMLRVVDFAILTEKKIELSYVSKDKKRILIRPIHLLKNKEPILIIATEVYSGTRNQYPINEITSLRIIE